MRLPHFFVLQGNNCEFIVDTVYDAAIDIFETRQIVDAAGMLVSECLVGSSRAASTLGFVLVGPRQRIQVILRRSGSQMVTGGNNTAPASSGTELAVMEVAPDSGANLTSAG